MKPTKEYNGRSTIRMYLGDCMDLMKTGTWDLAIVDPPYTDEISGLGAGMNRGHFNFDNFKAPKQQYVDDLMRVSRHQIMWGFNHYLELLHNTSGFVVWHKHQNGHFSECEMAWVSTGKGRFFDRPYQKDQYNKIHPTQKPVQLYKWLLTNYAKEGDTILDTHGGSMSIAIACWDLGFDLDICELDEDYFNDAVKRFENHVAQTQLF